MFSVDLAHQSGDEGDYRRLQKLEDGFGLGPETESERQLRARIEEGRRRVAELRARGELPPATSQHDLDDLSGLSILDILQRGRARAHACALG